MQINYTGMLNAERQLNLGCKLWLNEVKTCKVVNCTYGHTVKTDQFTLLLVKD